MAFILKNLKRKKVKPLQKNRFFYQKVIKKGFMTLSQENGRKMWVYQLKHSKQKGTSKHSKYNTHLSITTSMIWALTWENMEVNIIMYQILCVNIRLKKLIKYTLSLLDNQSKVSLILEFKFHFFLQILTISLWITGLILALFCFYY